MSLAQSQDVSGLLQKLWGHQVLLEVSVAISLGGPERLPGTSYCRASPRGNPSGISTLMVHQLLLFIERSVVDLMWLGCRWR